MHTSVPVGPIRSATSSACPPDPNVQSTAASPSHGSSRSISSPARTGMWARVISRSIANALRHAEDLRAELVLIGSPALAVPHLDVVVVPRDHDLTVDAGVLDQAGVERDATGRVELGVE